MRFDDINYNNDYNSNYNNRRPMKKNKANTTIYLIIGIVAIVLILLIVLLLSKPSSNLPTEQPTTSTINTDSRISRALYKKIHDFSNKGPFWMYSDDELGLVSEMKETTKMSLVYINIKLNDLKGIACSSIPDVEEYENYECKESTVSISKKIVEDIYRDLFGSDSKLSTSAVMKVDEKGSQAYFYEKDLDAYVLLNRKNEIEQKDNYAYKYELIEAIKVNEKIILYEVITEKNRETGKIKKNRSAYTFVADSDGLYNYYSIEKEV